MSAQSSPVDPQHGTSVGADICPHWCTSHGAANQVQELREVVHVSGPLMVKSTLLRLASSVDPDTRAPDGPLVYVGDEEYTLYQAEVLIDALTHLVDEGTGRTQFTGRNNLVGPAPSSEGGTSGNDSGSRGVSALTRLAQASAAQHH